MVVESYGIFLCGHTQDLTFRCVELDIIFMGPCVEVGQGFLQALAVSREADCSIQFSIISIYS